MLQGRFAEACQHLEEAADIYEDLGMRNALGAAIHLQAWAKVNLGAYDEAQRLYEKGLAVFRNVNDRHGVGLSHLGLGEIALVDGDYAASWALLKTSAAILEEVGQREEQSLALFSLALAARGMGRVAKTIELVQRGLRLAVETRALPAALFAVSVCALLLADADQAERALELYALVTRHPYYGDSVFHEDVVGGRIASGACDLPTQVVAAARERGRARDLQSTVLELSADENSWAKNRKLSGAHESL